ncbi:MAG: nucleoside deaminase, partial [Gammaproteobacteria bacterium]|nr:nucleoside deaminase [Gammaproteobacteria bacterium]
MTLDDRDARFLKIAYEEALAGFNEGGCPIGGALAEGDRLIATGRNQRVQQGDPIAHGEMDCLRKAGRQKTYRNMTLYTTLSPCMMCSGAILQFKIPKVVIGEATTFEGNPQFLRDQGVEIVIAD